MTEAAIPPVEEPVGASPMRPRAAKLRRRMLFRIAGLLLLSYCIWIVLLYFFQDLLIFCADLGPRPRPTTPSDALVITAPVEAGGSAYAWMLPATPDQPGRNAATVMFFHGNAELIDYQDFIVNGYRLLGINVVLPEYPGYGRSKGAPSERAIVDHCVSLYDELIRRPGIRPETVFFHGRSLGGGVAAQVATRRRPSALILEVTFTSVAAMSTRYWAPAFIARHPFRTDRALSDLPLPLLIFGASHDTVVPVEHSRALHALRPDARYIEYDTEHVIFPGATNVSDYWHEIGLFLRRAGLVE